MTSSKTLLTFFTVLLSVFTLNSKAQDTPPPKSNHIIKKLYVSQETEMIFSFANIDADSMNFDNIMRWSPVFNLMAHFNYDFSENFGVNLGVGFRNVGFIAETKGGEDGNDDLKTKFRTYNFGFPVGFRVGNLDQYRPMFFYGGYEFEVPFHYKEKPFINGDKQKDEKITAYFSDRVNPTTQALFAGVQFPQGFNVKFKYYLDEFFNQNYEKFEGNTSYKPYEGMDVNVFYFSITWYPFQSTKHYYDLKKD